MEHQIITFYILCHELLTAPEIREDCQIKMTTVVVNDYDTNSWKLRNIRIFDF